MSDKINNKDLKAIYGLAILTGRERLLAYPERKEPLNFDWQDQNGVDYYLSKVFFKDTEVTLQCAIMANDNVDFWVKYNAFFKEISQPNYQQLFIDDHDMNYQVFYKSGNNFKHSLKRLKNVNKVFVKFDLTIQVKPNVL
ncbi:hypothetical protein [Empedobacter sp.]|uniref:hypothetical protein n=1 Tax=Empedobacter sp. TaxID=1927715 RepID=UPI00289CBCBC|nr:hypothetical protein [Empedobacter sp.]